MSWDFFLTTATVFLILFPFSLFLHAVGLAPGLLFALLFSYLWAGLKNEHSLHAMIAIPILCVLVWMWGEAGKPGLVVMPVDLPEGRNDMAFTADGVANALETELERFGHNDIEGTYGDTEASKILARELSNRLFPHNPWYKGSDARPSGLVGLQASHIVVGTNVEGFPLSNVYHMLRHLRGLPLLEAQILIGDDHSLTLALRRSNGPLGCMGPVSDVLLLEQMPILQKKGSALIEELWTTTEQQRNEIGLTPDTRGCSRNVNPVRLALNWVDVATLPSAADERIANVTVHDLKGDTQLSEALRLAALEAVPHLSNERMALYYDNSGRYGSALSYLKKSVPDLLREVHEDVPNEKELAQQRLANAFVRIGDFEGQITGNCVASDRAYALAEAVSPNDFHVLARIGYGYLIRARSLDWGQESCKPDSQVNVAVPGEFPCRPELPAPSPQNSAVNDLLGKAIACLALSQQAADSDSALHLYGSKKRDETLGWVLANLAYASLLYSKSDPYDKRPSEWARNAVKVSGKDPRVVTAEQYVQVKKPGPIQCADLFNKLRDFDPLPEERSSPPSTDIPLTLHSALLMEEQLQQVYQKAVDSCDVFDDRRSKVYEHEFLFNSLLSLSSVQRGADGPEAPLKGLNEKLQRQLTDAIETTRKRLALVQANATGQNTEQGHLQQLRKEISRLDNAKRDRPAEISLRLIFLTEGLKISETNLSICSLPSKIVPGPKSAQDLARAWSLCARIESIQCSPGVDEVQKASRAVDAFPEDPFLLANLAIIRLKLNQPVAALRTLQRAVRQNPNEPRLRYLLALALTANGRPEEGQDQLNYGRDLDPVGWAKTVEYFEGDLSPCASAPIIAVPSTDAHGDLESSDQALPSRNDYKGVAASRQKKRITSGHDRH